MPSSAKNEGLTISLWVTNHLPMDTNIHPERTGPVVDRIVLGRRIAARRKATRMSQREFAAFAGLDPDRLAKLEVGRVIHPRFLEVSLIATALQVSLEELVYESPSPAAAAGGPP